MSKTEISIDDLVALVREELPEDQAKEFISKLNHRMNELAKEETEDSDDSEPKAKVEWNHYYIHDASIMSSEGAAPEFVIKVSSETLPTEIENQLQHALNNVKDRLSKAKSKRSKKKKTIDNLYSLAHEVKKGDFKENERVVFVGKDPVLPLPVHLTF